MAGDFVGFGRDFVEMIDERFNKSFRHWTPGTWAFAVIALAVLGFCTSLIAEYIIMPLWHFATWLSTGHPLAVLRQIQAGVIFETIVFFGMMIFLIFGGFSAVHGVTWAFFSMWSDKRTLRQQISDDLKTQPRWRRLTFYPMMWCSLVIILFMYVALVYWTIHQFAHDMGLPGELRAALSRCLQVGPPPPPVQLNMPIGK